MTAISDPAKKLVEEAYRFDFFQAVRLLERIARQQAAEDPRAGRQPVGRDHSPRREAVRFRVLPSHSFPTGSIAKLDRRPKPEGVPDDEAEAEGLPPEMIVAFLGLVGPSGVLPRHYTSLVIERDRSKDYSLRDFLDVFHHRTISLFYRAWEKYRFPFAYERAELDEAGEEDLFTRGLYSLVGLGTGGLRGRMAFDDEAFLFFAGQISRRPASAVSLEQVLSDYFDMPVRVRQFQGQWLYLSREDQSSLPGPGRSRGLNNELGRSLLVGERVWDVESRFRLRLGPLGYGQFCEFFPSGGTLEPLCQMVRSYVGPQFDFDVQPVLARDEVPPCQLGGDGPRPSRLGWNTWIASRPLDRDADDAVFSLEGLPWLKST